MNVKATKKIEYMVLTAHFVDLEWKLKKRVLNFVHLPPPGKGANIVDCILQCEIEDKVNISLMIFLIELYYYIFSIALFIVLAF